LHDKAVNKTVCCGYITDKISDLSIRALFLPCINNCELILTQSIVHSPS